MSLKLTNTLTRQVEVFRSIKPNEVSIYCCGVTVYDLCHLGHARSYIVWDVLRRYLLSQGYKVTFVQNFTDIDDKIIKRAAKEKSTMSEVSERNIKEFFKDMDALGILRPDRMPRATKCLESIRSMISELEKKGAAYSVDGDVYFAVTKHNGYGKLSGRDLLEQQRNAGGRITQTEESRKKHPFDFALWKSAKESEPSFSSPWGNGRPGWHIECSAMVLQELGETIDIHLGGADLIFPHHENEIAQSEISTGKKLASYWLHNGMVNVEGQKMSKSVGNFTTIRDLLKEGVSPMTLRFFVLQAHYRKPLDFTVQAMNAASNGWEKLNNSLCLGIEHADILNWSNNVLEIHKIEGSSDNYLSKEVDQLRQQFIDAMNSDLNTSAALAILFTLTRPLKAIGNQITRNALKPISTEERQSLYIRWTTLVQLAEILGLKGERNQKDPARKKIIPNLDEIKRAIKERNAAKSERNYEKADEIRNSLKEQGIELIDKPDGITDWIQI